MKKKSWLKKIYFLGGITFTSCIMASCNIKNEEVENIQTESNLRLEENENMEVITETNLEKDTEETKLLFPSADLWVQETNAYLCRDMNEALFKDYQSSLTKQGYELILEENVGGFPYYHYANEENRIQVIDAGTLVIVSFGKNYEDMATEEKALSNEDALKLIQNKEDIISYSVKPYNNTTQSSTQYQADIIVKHWIKDLYTKTNMLAYTGYTREGKKVGTYMIHDNMAFEIFDTLENTCVADLDQNGTYELLTLFGYGFGLYRINLNVYQCEKPVYFSSLSKIIQLTYHNCFVPENGYGELNFHKISDSKVHLVDGKDGKDYGPLVILEDGVYLEPEYVEEFPYYQWDEYFNFSTSMDEDKNQKTMNSIPKLEVSIGDTSLTTKARKVNWNGESEENIYFKDLMQDSVLRFDCPPGLFEYKDEICLSFEDATPTSISVEDIVITEDGEQIYGQREQMIREVRIGEDGNYYFGLQNHFALMLSSSSASYTNPSYRGFRVLCEFGDEKTCEYIFVLSLEPMWNEE